MKNKETKVGLIDKAAIGACVAGVAAIGLRLVRLLAVGAGLGFRAAKKRKKKPR